MGTAGTLASVPGSAGGALKEVASEGFSYFTGLPTFSLKPKNLSGRDASGYVIGRYFYDGEGKRVKKVTNLETTVFVYDGLGKLIAEYSTDIAPTPQTKYLTQDHLGTPRIITDAGGQITARRDFLPFGENLFAGIGNRSASQKYGATQDDIRQKFTGYQKDKETSLDFAEARMYENRFGRFTAVDPLLPSGKSANPQTFNRYVYTGNNPLTRTDPNGTDWYMHRELEITRNGRSYYSYTPVWYDRTVYGMNKWDKGVFQVGSGKNGGKWIALDPYNNNFKTFKSRAAAVAAYNGFIKQRNDDVAGGVVRTVTETFDSGLLINQLRDKPIYDSIATGLLNQAGISPDESSNVFRTTNRSANAIVAVGSAFGGELANLKTFSQPGTFRFSQTTASPFFSQEGSFSGKTIGEVATELRTGILSTKQVPVEFVTRGDVNLIVNTRSSLALQRANIPIEQWTLINRTGSAFTETNITNRLLRNNLTEQGTDVLRITGCRGSGSCSSLQ